MNRDPVLLSVARCIHLASCLAGEDTHPCAVIVSSQRDYATLAHPTSHQLPEPWVGHLDVAPILFLSSNPSIDPDEDFPTYGWTDDQVTDFSTNGFESGAIRDATHHRRSDGSFGRSHYWSEIKNRASEILGRPAVPGRDYALTEVVHCKPRSSSEWLQPSPPA